MNREEKLQEADRLDEQARALRTEAYAERDAEERKRPIADRLCYAATARCPCGAGLAYDPVGESGKPIHGYWDCAAILRGDAVPANQPGTVQHCGQYPFAFYEIKSEGQPSAYGMTTRPAPSGADEAGRVPH